MGLVFAVQLLSESRHLTAFEVGDLDRSPALGSPGHGGEHQLEDSFLAEGIRNDLQAPALFEEETLEEIRCLGRPAVGDGKPEVSYAGLEIVLEAGDRARQLGLVVLGQALGQVTGNRPAGSLVGGGGPYLEIGPSSAGGPSGESRSRSP